MFHFFFFLSSCRSLFLPPRFFHLPSLHVLYLFTYVFFFLSTRPVSLFDFLMSPILLLATRFSFVFRLFPIFPISFTSFYDSLSCSFLICLQLLKFSLLFFIFLSSFILPIQLLHPLYVIYLAVPISPFYVYYIFLMSYPLPLIFFSHYLHFLFLFLYCSLTTSMFFSLCIALPLPPFSPFLFVLYIFLKFSLFHVPLFHHYLLFSFVLLSHRLLFFVFYFLNVLTFYFLSLSLPPTRPTPTPPHPRHGEGVPRCTVV